jgi:hypothetical protein
MQNVDRSSPLRSRTLKERLYDTLTRAVRGMPLSRRQQRWMLMKRVFQTARNERLGEHRISVKK